jgi:phage portal protein BeeE
MSIIRRLAGLGLDRKSYRTGELLPAYRDGQPLPREWDEERAVKEGFKLDPTVYACVRVRAQALGSLPWVAFTLEGDRWEASPGHRLERLMEAPNPKMTGPRLVKRGSMQLDLGGNFLWTKLRPGFDPAWPADQRQQFRENNPPAELWPIDLRPVRPITSKAEFIRGYEYHDGDAWKPLIDAADVVHHLLDDPGSEGAFWGMGRLQAASWPVDTAVAARKWNRQALDDRAVIDGAFAVDFPMTTEQYEAAQEQIKKHYGKRTPMGLSPVDMDFFNGLNKLAEEICSVFDVRPPMIGIMRDATLANVDAMRRSWWEDSILTDADDIELTLNLHLTPEFGRTPDARFLKCANRPLRKEVREWLRSGEKDARLAREIKAPARRRREEKEVLWLGYDTSNVEALQVKLAEKVDLVQKMVNMGIRLNDALQRAELDLPPQPGGDVPRWPANMVPIDADPEEDEEDAAKLGAA